VQANSTSANNVTLSLFRGRFQKAGKVDKRDAKLPSITKINPHVVEARSQVLWKTFHRTVAIENRTSPSLQRQFMPVCYWKHLTEMQA